MYARQRDAKPSKPVGQLPQSVAKPLEHVVWVASVGVLLSLTYLLFIILSGGLAAPLIAGTALEQVTRNVGMAKNAFLWSLWIVVIAAMIRHHRNEAVGWVTMLIGGACWAVLPLLVRSRIESTSAQALMQLGQSLVGSFQTAGGALVMLGFLRVAVGRIIVLASPTKAAARFSLGSPSDAAALAAERAMEKPSLMRRCWELHFCRTGLRANCPRFLGGQSCWRAKSGCYCDQGLATRLLSGMGANARAQLAQELETAQRRARNQARRQSKQKRPCGECPLYLEHQKHKYRVISWFAYPAAAAIIGGSIGIIREGYRWVEFSLGSMLARFQVLPDHLPASNAFEATTPLSAENAMVLLLGVLLVGLLLEVAELAIFKLKL